MTTNNNSSSTEAAKVRTVRNADYFGLDYTFLVLSLEAHVSSILRFILASSHSTNSYQHKHLPALHAHQPLQTSTKWLSLISLALTFPSGPYSTVSAQSHFCGFHHRKYAFFHEGTDFDGYQSVSSLHTLKIPKRLYQEVKISFSSFARRLVAHSLLLQHQR